MKILKNLIRLILIVTGAGLLSYCLPLSIISWTWVEFFLPQSMSPGKVTFHLSTAFNTTILALLFFELDGLISGRIKNCSNTLQMIFILLATDVAMASIIHESFTNKYGEGLYMTWPEWRDLLGYGSLTLIYAIAFTVSLAVAGENLHWIREKEKSSPGNIERLSTIFLALCGFFHMLTVFKGLKQDFHFDAMTNMTTMAECFVMAFVVGKISGCFPGSVGKDNSWEPFSWIALIIGLDCLRTLSKQHTFPGVKGLWIPEQLPEYLIHTSGRIWSNSSVLIQLSLSLSGTLLLVYFLSKRSRNSPSAQIEINNADLHSVKKRGLTGKFSMFVNFILYAIVLSCLSACSAIGISAAIVMIMSKEPLLAAIEVFSFSFIMLASGLKAALVFKGKSTARQSVSIPAMTILLSLTVLQSASLIRLIIFSVSGRVI